MDRCKSRYTAWQAHDRQQTAKIQDARIFHAKDRGRRGVELTTREASNSILVTTTAAVGLAALSTLLMGGWTMPIAGDFRLIAPCGLITGCGHYCMIETFQLAEAGLVAPFRYSSILWAGGLGCIFWGELPERWVVVGDSLIFYRMTNPCPTGSSGSSSHFA